MPAKTPRSTPAAPAAPSDLDALADRMSGLILAATAFVPPAKVQDAMRGWLGPGLTDLDDLDDHAMAEAMAMATDLALFTPSFSGQTAFDRLARQARGMAAEDAAALAVLRQGAFRVLRVLSADDGGKAVLRDLAADGTLRMLDRSFGPDLAGLPLTGRTALLPDGTHLFIGPVTPLDDAGLAVAMGFVRPGGRGLSSQVRCAEAVYRHVLRNGTLRIPGLNDRLDDGLPEELGLLDEIAARWAAPGAAHGAARGEGDVQAIRTEASLDAVVAVILSVINTRLHAEPALCSAYGDILRVQLETVHRRQSAGSSLLGLDAVAAAIAAEVGSGALPPEAEAVLDDARRRLGAAPAGDRPRDAELNRLIGRIQALRAKTVAQGCTEAEAMAAAEKVAELLDRYGLSLSELDLKRQSCEGAAVETGRKRAGPLDECVPSIGAFFDCRVWGEKGAEGRLRYVFFGLPADVAGARYLYDLVEQAFETETAEFRAGATYLGTPAGMRRTATNSFGVGLSRGINAKLHALRMAREGALRGGASGRDLVVAKEDVVEAELARLGLRLRVRKGLSGRRLLHGAYQEGHEAGLGFEYAPGLGHEG